MMLQSNDDESSAVSTCSAEEFAVPDSLVHQFVIVPSKLRLVTLAAFLLWKCRVSVVDVIDWKRFWVFIWLWNWWICWKCHLTYVLYFSVCVHLSLLIYCSVQNELFVVAVFAFLLLNSCSSTINAEPFCNMMHKNVTVFNDNSVRF